MAHEASSHAEINLLQQRIAALEQENAALRQQQQQRQARPPACYPLDAPTVARYARQLILPEIGAPGQRALQDAAVAIVGVGGLGCPVAAYLAASGIGRLGLIDRDVVDVSNLHRQVLHTESSSGEHKVDSAARELLARNSKLRIDRHRQGLTVENALEILQPYTLVIDATDNAPTRYLVNDACVILDKPLVSGSALRWDGQLTVYNYRGSPCYRCLYPVPPPPETVTNCSDGGVIGPVPGFIGCLQAMEAIKVIVQMAGCADAAEVLAGRLLSFDGLRHQMRVVKLRTRRPDCASCGNSPEAKRLMDDYEAFCHMDACDATSAISLLPASQRLSVADLRMQLGTPTALILDVRPAVEFGIAALPGSLSLPITRVLQQEDAEIASQLQALLQSHRPAELTIVCRRGNDSQRAVQRLRQLQEAKLVPDMVIRDVVGGLQRWAREQEPDFPIY